MKWNSNDVEYQRGCYRPVIFRFDNSEKWLNDAVICSTGSIRSTIRRMGQTYGAKSVEVRWMFDEEDRLTVPSKDIVSYFYAYDGNYYFRNELRMPEGEKRQFLYYDEKEIFPGGKIQKELDRDIQKE